MLSTFGYIWDFEIYHIGNASLTLGKLISFGTVFALLYLFSFKAFYKITERLFSRLHIPKHTAARFSSSASYIIFFLGTLVTLEAFGIDMTTFSIIGGAIGIGIGLGLQNIANNFISGIIMFFEKPIKIGDRVELDNIQGNIHHISFRATTIVTNDNITIIVPNSFFTQNKITNWSHTTSEIRIHVPVSVSYKENPEAIRELLMQIASETQGIIDTKPPLVIFTGMGESSLNFELLVWTDKFVNAPALLRSNLYFTIFDRFKKANIEIPFPQRDIHIISKTDLSANS